MHVWPTGEGFEAKTKDLLHKLKGKKRKRFADERTAAEIRAENERRQKRTGKG